MDLVAYCDLTHQPAPLIESYTQSLRFWYPLRDFIAYLELRKKGALTFPDWVKSVVPFEHVSPLWSSQDPWPAAGAAVAIMKRLIRGPK